MGSDTPIAVLSERPQLLYNYFKQLFAQITNPPVDAIREELIMSTDTSIGPEAICWSRHRSVHGKSSFRPQFSPTRSWRS